MSDEEIIVKLEQFQDYLSVGSLFSDPFRWLGWVLIQGLSLLLDGLEKVTDEVLLIKLFFTNPDVVAFVSAIRPFLYLLLAFSLLYAGYMLIYQKKFDREGMAVNVFIALMVLALLGTSMEKANEFTDEAIQAIGAQQLYEEEEGTLSQNILSRNIHDLVQFDSNGWSNTELDRPNTIPLSMIGGISITEKFDKERDELDMSPAGRALSNKQLVWGVNEKGLSELYQGVLGWKNQFYYRFSPDWITLATTIVVMAFTLFSIAYKLARLSFELAFNYVLAMIIAPADVHDGQKTKKILQSILNTFLVIILIFLSMKVYMIGTSYISDTLSGFTYLIVLIAFSVAVIDGPNIVERLFGIDAGLKSGWGVLAAAYAGSRMIGGLKNGLSNASRHHQDPEDKGKGSLPKRGSGSNLAKVPSPNEEEENSNKFGIQDPGTGTGEGSMRLTGEGVADSEKGSARVTGIGSVSRQAEAQQAQQRKQGKALSPNDQERGMGMAYGIGQSPAQVSSNGSMEPSGSQIARSSGMTETAKVTDQANVQQNVEVAGTVNTIRGAVTGGGRGDGGQPPNNAGSIGLRGTGGTHIFRSSNVTDPAKVTDHATVVQNTEISREENTVRGATTSVGSPSGQFATDVGSSVSRGSSGSKLTEHRRITAEHEIAVTTEVQYIQNQSATRKTHASPSVNKKDDRPQEKKDKNT